MKTNMLAVSYQPRILSPKYGQTVKALTEIMVCPLALKWPNLDLKVSDSRRHSWVFFFFSNYNFVSTYENECYLKPIRALKACLAAV